MNGFTDELAFVGAEAKPRPEVVKATRAALVTSSRSFDPAGLGDREVWQIGRAMFQHARALRKSGKSKDAVSLYLGALVRFEAVGEVGDVSACLTGAGLGHLELAKESLQDARRAALEQRTETGAITSIFSLARQAMTRRTVDHATKSRLCHLWALELEKELGSVAGQAGRIANLAITETLLGNLDTAKRYVVWALDVHRAATDPQPVAIDLTLLADIDRALGDEEAAAAHKREADELSDAPTV